jgi:glutathione peroxidase-family protein
MSLHDFSLNTLSGESVKLDKYKGKVVLLENAATL